MFYYLFIIILVAFSFASIVFNIGLEMKHSLELFLMFISIFATFIGAYLGAKIAGEYSINVSEKNKEFEINRHIKKAKYIREIYVKQCVTLIRQMRPQDLPVPSKYSSNIESNYILLVFKEDVYERVNEYKLEKLNDMIEKLNSYRLSDSYFYNTDQEIMNIDQLVDLLETVKDLLYELNNFLEENMDEEDFAFKIKKDKLFKMLTKLYDIISKERETWKQ